MGKTVFPPLDGARIRQVIDYEPSTGIFRWKHDSFRRTRAGKIAGCINALGYLVVRVDNRLYLGHRLAWLWMTGSWPTNQIDHKDMDRSNNRWDNLRDADNSGNNCNRPAHRDSVSGVKGVYYDDRMGFWVARIHKDGVKHWLGHFLTKDEAAIAYADAAAALHGEFART